MLLKAADVCNEARPWSISEPWAKALFAEHAEQVALEQQHGLPVTAWMQNDTLPKQAKSQLGFIDFVLLPLVAVMRKSAPPLEAAVSEFEQGIRCNRERWVPLNSAEHQQSD